MGSETILTLVATQGFEIGRKRKSDWDANEKCSAEFWDSVEHFFVCPWFYQIDKRIGKFVSERAKGFCMKRMVCAQNLRGMDCTF